MNALPTTQFVVDGTTYTTRLMSATESLDMLPRLIRLLGRRLVHILLSTKSEELAVMLQDPEVIASMLATVAENAKEEPLTIMRDLLRNTKFEKQASENTVQASAFSEFDEHFSGHMMRLVMVSMQAARASFTRPS